MYGCLRSMHKEAEKGNKHHTKRNDNIDLRLHSAISSDIAIDGDAFAVHCSE